jgi:hypothetical protein
MACDGQSIALNEDRHAKSAIAAYQLQLRTPRMPHQYLDEIEVLFR